MSPCPPLTLLTALTATSGDFESTPDVDAAAVPQMPCTCCSCLSAAGAPSSLRRPSHHPPRDFCGTQMPTVETPRWQWPRRVDRLLCTLSAAAWLTFPEKTRPRGLPTAATSFCGKPFLVAALTSAGPSGAPSLHSPGLNPCPWPSTTHTTRICWSHPRIHPLGASPQRLHLTPL